LKKTEINSVEIAKLAGVSRSTVSRVINNYPNVPAKTREKVMKVIQQYNYFPNMSAQVLAGKKTRTIGLFMVDAGHVSTDAISNMLISSVIEHASTRGYYVLTHIIRDVRDVAGIERVREIFYQRRVDGGVFIGTDNHEPFVEELIAEGFIVAVVDQDLPGRSEPNRIVFNIENELGAMKAVDYLVSLNHRNIGAINGNMKRFAGPAKYQGFLQAMHKHALNVRESWIMSGDFNESSGYRAMLALLKTNSELPTAIFTANDSVAFGAIRALQEHDMKVPDDISIIGFDDHVLSARFQPALTTVRVDFRAMIEKLITALVRVIEHGTGEFTKSTVGTTLIVRESCRRV